MVTFLNNSVTLKYKLGFFLNFNCVNLSRKAKWKIYWGKCTKATKPPTKFRLYLALRPAPVTTDSCSTGLRRQALQGGARLGHGHRRRGGEDPRSHEEHRPHPPRPERHHQGQSPDHSALHPIQEW